MMSASSKLWTSLASRRGSEAFVTGLADALLVSLAITFISLLLAGTESWIDRTLELAQSFVVYSLAAAANLHAIRERPFIAVRLLLICLPLTILFGFAIGLLVIPMGTFVELTLLATVAAAADPGGLRGIGLMRGKLDTHDDLRLECILSLVVLLPATLLLMSLSRGMLQGVDSMPAALGRELIVSALTGGAIGYIGSHFIRIVDRRLVLRSRSDLFSGCLIATATFLMARFMDVDGMLAALIAGFVSNLSMGTARSERAPTQDTAEVVSLGAGIVFLVCSTFQVLPWIDWRLTCYSGLGLLVARPLAVSLCLCRSGLQPCERAELSFFKTSGLVAAILAIQAKSLGLACADTLIATVVCTLWLTLAMQLAQGLKLPLFRRFPPSELEPAGFFTRFVAIFVVATLSSALGAFALLSWVSPDELKVSADRQAAFFAMAFGRASAIPLCTATTAALLAPVYRKTSYVFAAFGVAMAFAFWMVDFADLLNWICIGLEKTKELVRESATNWKMYFGE